MPINQKLDFSDETILRTYIKGLVEDKIFHINYDDNVEQAQQMGVHLKGDSPEKLLETLRPNEPTEVRTYRLEIYEPITKSQGKRIINVLSKIQQSSNFTIKFPEQTNVPEDETLQSYTQENYPEFGSLESWAFDVGLKQDLLDANSLVVVKPLVIPDDNVTFLKPFTFIYRSDQVLDYGFNYYTILLDEKNVVNDVSLNIWEIVTDVNIFTITQVNPSNEGEVAVEVIFTHNFGETPAYFMKGDYREETVPFAYDSFISGVLPYWNKAVRMDSDLDAQLVCHLYLERVEQEVECDADCQKHGDGKLAGHHVIVRDDGQVIICQRCKGSGFINGRGPYGVTSVRKESFDENGTIEFPGVTYIDKPIDIIEITDSMIDKNISKGFSSVNMDIIDKVGENQSGKAKDIDRTELSSFLNKVSDNMFDNIIKNAYKFISMWRFSVINDVILPVINKPTTFNALNETLLVEEIKTLDEAGIDTTQLELDLIDKKFPNDIEKQSFNKNIIELDPLAGKKEEDKLDIKMGGGVTQEQFIISSNIRGFIMDALEQDPEFLLNTREQKMAKLIELAQKQILTPIENGIIEEPTEEPNGTANLNG